MIKQPLCGPLEVNEFRANLLTPRRKLLQTEALHHWSSIRNQRLKNLSLLLEVLLKLLLQVCSLLLGLFQIQIPMCSIPSQEFFKLSVFNLKAVEIIVLTLHEQAFKVVLGVQIGLELCSNGLKLLICSAQIRIELGLKRMEGDDPLL